MFGFWLGFFAAAAVSNRKVIEVQVVGCIYSSVQNVIAFLSALVCSGLRSYETEQKNIIIKKIAPEQLKLTGIG